MKETHLFDGGEVQKIGNVLKIRYQKDTPVTVEDMKAITEIRKKLFGDNPYCSLIDLSDDDLMVTKEAQKYVSDTPFIKKLRIAEVLLVKNFTQKIGVHTYVRITRWKDNITVMTLKDEDNAIDWLERQYKKYMENNKVKVK